MGLSWQEGIQFPSLQVLMALWEGLYAWYNDW